MLYQGCIAEMKLPVTSIDILRQFHTVDLSDAPVFMQKFTEKSGSMLLDTSAKTATRKELQVSSEQLHDKFRFQYHESQL